jgi:hypothetical protein
MSVAAVITMFVLGPPIFRSIDGLVILVLSSLSMALSNVMMRMSEASTNRLRFHCL